jgi:benzoate 4-monooxygenase
MKYFYLDPFWYNGLRSVSSLGAVGTAAFQKRKAKPSSERKEFNELPAQCQRPWYSCPLPEKEIIAEAIAFIGGGSHRTSHTMTHFMDFVSRDQKLQDEIWNELFEAFPRPMDPNWVAPDEVVSRLPLLNATLKEVMRFRPTSSTGLERVVPEGGRIIGDVFFPPGCLVSVPIVAIHHNGTIFEVSHHMHFAVDP